MAAENKRVKSKIERYKALLDKASKGNSRKLAIKAKCLDCCNWSISEVKKCPIQDCPLWSYRPGNTKNKSEQK